MRQFGIINEDNFDFHSPRVLDEGPFDTLPEAFAAAARAIQDGTGLIAIVSCRYSERRDVWVEIVDGCGIQIDAGQFETDADLREARERKAAKKMATAAQAGR